VHVAPPLQQDGPYNEFIDATGAGGLPLWSIRG